MVARAPEVHDPPSGEAPADGDGRIPRLGHGVRLRVDKVTAKHLLLRPEQGFELRGSALDIVRLCDGTRTVDQIIETLCQRFTTAFDDGGPAEAGPAKIAEDVRTLLRLLASRRLVEFLGEEPSPS
jgi:pyrroloquinoline quinone biosynthesis protein D